MVLWQGHGDQIRRYRKERGQSVSLPGEDFYFKPGVTYSYIGTRGFKARLLSPGSVFDIASSAVFSRQEDHLYLVGFLNSALVRYIMSILNPTINFQIGDLRRIPFRKPSEKIRLRIRALSKEAVEMAKTVESFDRSSPMFMGSAAGERGGSRKTERDC